MKAPKIKSRSRGLTLIEMLITLGVIALLTVVAVPSLMDTLNRMAVTSAARTIGSALSLARSEAVKRGRNVSICPSTSGTDCAAGTWATGWIVFVDANGDADGAAGSVDTGDTVIRVYTALADLALTTSPTTNLVTYDNKGFGKLSAVTTFKLCPQDGASANAKSVEVSLSGRARVISSGVSCS
jgi:type IV fimbrial biogenesis protein FimT